VRPSEEFDGEAATCLACLSVPEPVVRKKAAPVVRTRIAPRPVAAPATEAGPRKPLLGSVGSGDLEVRERRARRAAQQALADTYPEEFALLLRDTRKAEGLRSLSVGTTGDEAPSPES